MKNFILMIVVLMNCFMIFCALKNFTSSYVLTSRVDQLKTEINVKESGLKLEKQRADEFEKKFNEIEIIRLEVQKELKEKRSEASNLAKQLAKEKQKRKELERKLKKAEKKIKSLKDEVKKEKSKNQNLEGQIERMAKRLEMQEGDKQSLLNRLDGLKNERDTIKNKLKKLDANQPAYSLEEITVSEQKQYAGIVLNVNQKFNFCIVSIGKSDGIVTGIELIAHRGTSLIGKLKIERVYDKMSAAKIVSLSSTETIQVEDRVRKF